MTLPHQVIVQRIDPAGPVVVYDRIEYDYGYVCGRGTPQDKASSHALARLEDWLRTPPADPPSGRYRLLAYRLRDATHGTEPVRLVASVSMRHGRTPARRP